MLTQIKVELERIEVVKGPCVINIDGIGSGVAVLAYEETSRVGGAAYVLFGTGAGAADHPGRFAQTAIPTLLEQMERLGADLGLIHCVLVGGGSVFGEGSKHSTGDRTVSSVQEILGSHSIPILASELGGTSALFAAFDLSVAEVSFRTALTPAKVIAKFGGM